MLLSLRDLSSYFQSQALLKAHASQRFTGAEKLLGDIVFLRHVSHSREANASHLDMHEVCASGSAPVKKHASLLTC